VKILQWILPQASELKEFSSLLCLSAHFLDALLAEYLLHRTFNSSVFFCAPLHLLNALLAELSESSVILFLFKLTTEFFLCALLALRSMPTWQSSHRTPQRFCLLLNSQQSSFQLHLVHMLNAHLAELYRIHSRILSATVSLIHSLASKVFNNLEVFLLSC
jgi:hypothetical protein